MFWALVNPRDFFAISCWTLTFANLGMFLGTPVLQPPQPPLPLMVSLNAVTMIVISYYNDLGPRRRCFPEKLAPYVLAVLWQLFLSSELEMVQPAIVYDLVEKMVDSNAFNSMLLLTFIITVPRNLISHIQQRLQDSQLGREDFLILHQLLPNFLMYVISFS